MEQGDINIKHFKENKINKFQFGKGESHLNSLPKKKKSSMCSFTSNMNYHITLQTKGTSICLAIEESYIQIEQTHNKQQPLQELCF